VRGRMKDKLKVSQRRQTWLACALCLYIPNNVVNDAVTVINGVAVCDDHLGIPHNTEFSQMIRAARGEALF